MSGADIVQPLQVEYGSMDGGCRRLEAAVVRIASMKLQCLTEQQRGMTPP
jgi:hypothetical protein